MNPKLALFLLFPLAAKSSYKLTNTLNLILRLKGLGYIIYGNEDFRTWYAQAGLGELEAVSDKPMKFEIIVADSQFAEVIKPDLDGSNPDIFIVDLMVLERFDDLGPFIMFVLSSSLEELLSRRRDVFEQAFAVLTPRQSIAMCLGQFYFLSKLSASRDGREWEKYLRTIDQVFESWPDFQDFRKGLPIS